MFLHNFKYTFKVLLKKKILIFWTILWPLILGTMFYLAFANINNSEKLDTINLGVVDNQEYINDKVLSETLKMMGDKNNESHLFNISYGNEEKINKLLEEKEISGYIIKDENTKVVIKENGINQTIIKYVVDEIYEYEALTTIIIENSVKENLKLGTNPDVNKIHNEIMSEINNNKSYLKEISKKDMNYMVIEFYTLIAMTALLGALITSEVVSNYLANINKKGARVTLAPVNRMTILLGGLLSCFIVQAFAIGILLTYTTLILNVDYGSRFDLVILLSLVGSLAGNSLGLVAGSMTFKNENSRVGLVMSVTMLGCFLAGMMGVSMKYIIDKNMSIINLFNPANMITDGFYALYYYDNLDRFWFNIGSLLILSIILLTISYILMRRKKYDSI